MNKNVRVKDKKHIKYSNKKSILFKSKLKQMEISYNINDAKKFYQEVNSIRKGLLSQTLLIGIRKVT